MVSHKFQAHPVLFPTLALPGISVAPIWCALGILMVVDMLWLWASPLSLSADSWRALAALVPMVMIGVWASVRLDQTSRLYLLAQGFTFLLLAWPTLRIYNHLTMSIPMPLADGMLSAGDAMIGFDWMAYVLWLDRHPHLITLMDYSYSGLTNYSLVLFVLILLGRQPTERCHEMIRLFFASAVTCSSIGMFFPAAAAAAHYGVRRDLFVNVDPWVGAYHQAHLTALRTDPAHVLSLNDLPGLVTFPSFHTAMGVIAIYCARGAPWLLGLSLLVNVTMIASTPLFGSHYLVDILAGAGVALSAILVFRRLPRQPEPTTPTA